MYMDILNVCSPINKHEGPKARIKSPTASTRADSGWRPGCILSINTTGNSRAF